MIFVIRDRMNDPVLVLKTEQIAVALAVALHDTTEKLYWVSELIVPGDESLPEKWRVVWEPSWVKNAVPYDLSGFQHPIMDELGFSSQGPVVVDETGKTEQKGT